MAANVFAPLPSVIAGVYLLGTSTFLVSASIEFLVFVASAAVEPPHEPEAEGSA